MIAPKVATDAPKTFTPTARTALFVRQDGMCPWCGQTLRSASPEDMSAHHRLLRAQGGTWDLSNIVGLHPACHNIARDSVHQNPDRAYSLGFMIRTKRVPPADVPLHDRASMAWKAIRDWTDMNPIDAAEKLSLAGAFRQGLVR